MSTKIETSTTGEKTVKIRTEVEVESYADVDVNVPLDDIINDIIEALDPLQAEEIIKKAGFIQTDNLEGVALRRHLCQITGLAYTSDVDRIIDELKSRL